MSEQDWSKPDEALVGLVNDFHSRCLQVYKHDPNRVEEDAGKERGIAEGGYGRKQIQELVQNAADALRSSPGRIQVRLTADTLYVANEGQPFTDTGVRALLYTHLSDKVGGEIGRFGLGFKSISGISDRPQIFSTSVSFEFSRGETARELSVELGGNFESKDVPALRLAWDLRASQELAIDPALNEIAQWAATIIKVPLLPGVADQLSDEIAEFDESFNLFAPHVRQLDLVDDTRNDNRSFKATKAGNRVTLTAADGEREWLVFSKEHRPSEAALESAGHSARRESIQVSWAVQRTGKGIGQLCAYFPVKSETSLSGRMNAPWKLSDDRINVIECAFNHEILTEVLPVLVVEARKELIADGDYGHYIDVLPARDKEERSWAGKVLNRAVYTALRGARCLPDLDGVLRSPNALRRVPNEVDDHVQVWLKNSGNREAWVHPDCTSNKDRRATVDRLMEGNQQAVGRIYGWLQSVVADATPEHSAVAVEIAASVQSLNDAAKMDVRECRIVLLENGRLAQPVRGRCFIRTDAQQAGTVFIDGEVAKRPTTVSALEQLGITTFDDGGEMLELLASLAGGRDINWDNLWSAMRGSGESAVGDAFERILQGKAASVVRVKNGRGQWVLPESKYLPGERLKSLSEDGDFLVDGEYHAADRELLSLLGVKSKPSQVPASMGAKWIGSYMNYLRSEVGDLLTLSRPARDRLVVEGIETVLGPLGPLPELSATNKTALSVAALELCHLPRVRVTHPQVGKAVQFIAPEFWWVRQHGLLPTTLGNYPVREAFQASVDKGEFHGLLPTVSDVDLSSDAIAALGLRSDITSLSPVEFASLIDLHVRRDDVERVGRLYAWWCYSHHEQPPSLMWVKTDGSWAELKPDSVAVAPTSESRRDLDEFGIPFIVVDSAGDADDLRELWGCKEGRDLPFSFSYETSAEPVCLTDMFDVFDEVELDVDADDLTVQKCLSIGKVASIPGRAEVRVDCSFAREGNVLLVTADSDRGVLKQALGCLEQDNSDEQVQAFLDSIEAKRDSKLMHQIRKAATDDERLLLFAGEDRLKALIPRDALEYLSSSAIVAPGGKDLAALCVGMFGPRSLEKVCKIDPQSLPTAPPTRWHGSYQTRKWVRDLNFGDEWAGEKARQRNKPTEYIEGPTRLKPFHDYQQEVSDRLLGMLIGDGPNRGIISLPTGAGKTRVAVETIVEAISGGAMDDSRKSFSGPILWLTEGEELCEQAIDAWSYLWRAKGQQDTQLVLSRFWANYPTEEESGGVQVVVATWQKILSAAVDKPHFAWLAESPLVVIDEAHGALHKSYTEILRWTGRGTRERDRPLLGLTATPFRGRRDSDETQRLLRRFDDNLLDEGVFGAEIPQVRLQRDKVLARAELEILYGVSITLSDSELEDFRTKYWMPKDAEKRLGQNEDRTRKIINSIMEKPDEWPIVVFAASVENAQTLATLLTLQGRPAASIDNDTSPEDRKSAIERFKRGELRVLTNYAVLSQGFDAPKTRAVYITRPTTSEVRYQQMIGRGLRGPKNGGSEEVLIVNVLDNVVEFADSIVYDTLKEIIAAESAGTDAAGA